MQSLFWGRTDYQDLNHRKLARNHSDDRWPEWVWQGSASLGETAQIFAGELGGGGYGAPIDFNSQSFDKMAQVRACTMSMSPTIRAGRQGAHSAGVSSLFSGAR